MTDQERRHVTDLLAAHEVLIHWCETLITAHADLVELASEADLLNPVENESYIRYHGHTSGSHARRRDAEDDWRAAGGPGVTGKNLDETGIEVSAGVAGHESGAGEPRGRTQNVVDEVGVI